MVVVHGRTEEKTCCSRMRRAISWVYWPPKSRTTTPPSSELGRSWCCCCIWAPLDIVLLCSTERAKYESLNPWLSTPVRPDLNPQVQKADLSYRQQIGDRAEMGRSNAAPLRYYQVHQFIANHNSFYYALAVYVLGY